MTEMLGKVAASSIDAIRNETATKKKERKELEARRKELVKAQRKKKREDTRGERARGKLALREADYTRPVIFFNLKTGEFVKTERPEVIVYPDRIAKEKRQYEVRGDGRCTSDEVHRAYVRKLEKEKRVGIPIDENKVAKTVYSANPTPKQLARWERSSNRVDVEGVDAPVGSMTVPPMKKTSRTSKKKTNQKGQAAAVPRKKAPIAAKNKKTANHGRNRDPSYLEDSMAGRESSEDPHSVKMRRVLDGKMFYQIETKDSSEIEVEDNFEDARKTAIRMMNKTGLPVSVGWYSNQSQKYGFIGQDGSNLSKRTYWVPKTAGRSRGGF